MTKLDAVADVPGDLNIRGGDMQGRPDRSFGWVVYKTFLFSFSVPVEFRRVVILAVICGVQHVGPTYKVVLVPRLFEVLLQGFRHPVLKPRPGHPSRRCTLAFWRESGRR